MPKAQSFIHFYPADRQVPLRDRRKLKSFIRWKFQDAGIPLHGLSYIFSSDPYLLDINIRFLSHDFLTDIITFPLQEGTDPVEGEIYISVDRVRDNAQSLALPFQEELLRVIFHGALHLMGYTDKSSSQKGSMRRAEDAWLAEYQMFHVEQKLSQKKAK